MGTQYSCGSERRRSDVRASDPPINGIDYLEVIDQDFLHVFPDSTYDQNVRRQRYLLVRLFQNVPVGLDESNITITGGVRVSHVSVLWARGLSAILDDGGAGLSPALEGVELDYLAAVENPESVILVRTNASGDFSAYTLWIVESQTNSAPMDGFDVQLYHVDFSFKVECPSDFDCKPLNECPAERVEEPLIDYLTKDYESFRRLMLDRLSITLPDWPERSPADIEVALVELLAYAADYLSYYQDAVGTEAYLGTARKRVSIRRHARLLDYAMHDGRNSRAWVTVDTDDNGVYMPKGTPLLTKSDKIGAHASFFDDLEAVIQDAVNEGSQVFETMEDATFYAANGTVKFYTWDDEECCLPSGARRATLLDESDFGRLLLRAGDVLIFEEVGGAGTGLAADADPTHRHAVRLSSVYPEAIRTTFTGQELRSAAAPVYDPLTGKAVVEIEWYEEDALPFPLCISAVVGGNLARDLTVARGNVVPADHGWTIVNPDALEPSVVPALGKYRPRLNHNGLTQAPPYDPEEARKASANDVMALRLNQALPAISLAGDGDVWISQRDLLNSGRFAAEFVVEMEDDGSAFLRFGDDILGRKPGEGTEFLTTYRIGNGRIGNVGAGSIAHAATGVSSILSVRNPMPAIGGTDPEPIEQVRLYAPQAFRRQERAVLVSDYAEMAERHPGVQKAQATLRWTGSWHTVFVTLDRTGGLAVDEPFREEMLSFLDTYRLIDRDVEVNGPSFVSLDIAMEVCVKEGYYRAPVKTALLKLFSNRMLANGTLGFFHPDNLTFNQPIYLSAMITAAADVPGVKWVTMKRFQRWGRRPNGELDAGIIQIGRLEIARLDNDPSAPENGRIDITMKGGL
ncbi:MAG: putative baseplate assembly protein [Bacteroidetes bacterium]|nr:putative baseplate assembly protein [Bacteroidota bacterium]